MSQTTNTSSSGIYTPNNILITGGCGFIASNFINQLALRYPQYNFVNIDCLYSCSTTNNITVSDKQNYHFIRGNICSYDLVLFILNQFSIDTIVHFAAQSHVDSSFDDPIQCTKDNILGSHTLIEACRLYGKIRRFIYISTDEVYGESDVNDRNGKTERSLLCPTNPYSATKAASEIIIMSYFYSYKYPIIITRCNNVYGERQYPEKLIPKLACLLKEGKKCTIHGEGKSKRSFIYIDDVVSAISFILHKGQVGQVYNISSNDEFTVLDIAKKIIKKIKGTDDYEQWITFVKDREFNDMRYYINSEKLEKMGWSKKVNFDEGFDRTINWYLNSIDPYKHWDILHL
jgi:UDP-glucose 4,6-dehydratase